MIRQERIVDNTPSPSGDFYTPSHLVDLCVNVLNIDKNGTVYDPCCGSGALLLCSPLLMSQASTLQFYGQTLTPHAYKLCQTNLFLHSISADLGDKPTNTLIEDLHSDRTFDYILANPPFNSADWCGDRYPLRDPRWKYGLPPRSNANYAWLQHVISHLSDKGRTAIILPNGTLTTQTHSEQDIRSRIVCDGLVEAIIALPSKLFMRTRIPCCIWILDNSRKPGSSTLFVDARKLKLTPENGHGSDDIDKLANLILQYRNGIINEKTDWYAVSSLEEIAQNDFILSPNLYTLTPAIPLDPIVQNRPYFMKLIDTLNSQLGDYSLSARIHKWKYIPLPEHWEKAPLLELYHVSGGLTKEKSAFGHGTEIADVKTVIQHAFLPDTLPMRVDTTPMELEKYRIHAGDILLNRTSETIEELACCCVATEDRDAIYGNYIKCLHPIKTGLPDPLYMAAYFRSEIYRQEVKRVTPVYTTRASINMARLSKISVYYPETNMQHELGDTLFAIAQYRKECHDEALRKLLDQFSQLLIEQFITYPVLCLQKKETDDR